MFEQVLLIDDNDLLIRSLQLYLEAHGYHVHVANCGLDGFQLAKSVKPQAIVLDVNMPGGNGLETCRMVRADPALTATPIIVISAVSHERARQDAICAGANKFFAKPYITRQLIGAIRTEIENMAGRD